jgi:diguanylate cyclase (GGDEF)-like protein
MPSISRIAGYFARIPDPYAGGDLENAQRLSTVLWGLLVVLAIGLLPIHSPKEPSEGTGWAIAGALVALGVLLVIQCRRRRITSWGGLLAAGYGIVLGIGLLQWVTGGIEEPYGPLLLLPVVVTAATHPPRRIAPFMLLVFCVLMAPFVYDSGTDDQAAGAVATFVIWSALAVGGNLLMSGVRAQRISHALEEAEAREEARIDKLTGLHNRRAFDEILPIEVNRARRLGVDLTMAMVDIENFKEVNDRWSYAEGDRCLRHVAAVVRATLRDPDFCFRWGGDEFVLVMSGTSPEETGPIADRLQSEVAAQCRRPDETPLQIRFAVAELRDEMTPEELTELAGLALTAAKLDAS